MPPSANLCKSRKIRFQFVNSNILNNESVTKHHQGVIAYTSEFKYSATEDILDYAKEKGEDPFILILDGIEDPHNLGSILRNCDCLGVHGVIIEKTRACQVNETVIKTSAGATANMLIARVGNLNNTSDYLKKENIGVYCLETGGDEMTKSKLTGAIAIVVGSEGKGVSRLTREKCDSTVSIKLKGKVNSLNASVATAIMVYEIVRQRG